MGFSKNNDYSKYSRCPFQSHRTILVQARIIMIMEW